MPRARLGVYRVIRPLGKGGAGQVHEVEDDAGRRWALKELTPGDATALLRFRREVEVLAALDHPNVLRLHDAALDSSTPYLVTELLPGGSLADRLRAGPLPADDVARLGRDLADGLAHAHARGILHRDVKPSNVVFDAAGRPKLVDFGIARAGDPHGRLTRTGELLGTPAFMAPEQALADGREDERTDVYGLGATLHAAASGEPPFDGVSSLVVLQAVLSRPPRPLPPTVDAGLASVILRAMHKDPGARFPSAAALQRACAPHAGRRARPLALAPARALTVLLTAVIAGVIALRLALEGERPAQGPTPAAPGQRGSSPPRADVAPALPAWIGSTPVGARPDRLPPGCEWLDDLAGVLHRRTGMTLLWVPAADGQPGFFAGRHELTWGDVDRAGVELVEIPPYFDRDPSAPVHSIMPDRAARLVEQLGLRLPTDAEWDRLARGPDARCLPWGDQPPWTPERANLARPEDQLRVAKVGSFASDRAPSGCLDVLGNVAELVTDERRGPPRWIRGGSWSTPSPCDLTTRRELPRDYDHGVGLRAVSDSR